jgi:AraC-like DNA-binding protein
MPDIFEVMGLNINSEVILLEENFPLRTFHTGNEQLLSMDVMHRHDGCEIALMKSGSGMYKLVDRTIEMFEGDMAVFGPRVPHQLITKSGATIIQPVIIFAESLFNVERGFAFSEECAGAVVNQGSSLAYRIGAEEPLAQRLRECFDRLVAELDDAQYGYRTISLAILSEMIWLFIRRFSESEPLRKAGQHISNRLSAVVDYIGRNYMWPLRLSDAAAVANLNPSHFSTQFRKAYGVTFTEYLAAFRVRKAVWMLSNTDGNITTIANECGFGSVAIFYRHFARYTGTTPKMMRANRVIDHRPILLYGTGGGPR